MITASSLAQLMTDSGFYIEALADFVERRRQRWEDLLAVLTKLIEEADFDGDAQGNDILPTADRISKISNDALQEAGISLDAPVMLDDGYVKARDLAASVLETAYENQNGVGEAPLKLNGQPLTLDTPGGTHSTAPDLFSLGAQMQSSLHSVTALAAAMSAQIAGGSVDAKLSIFRDKMCSIFQDAYDDISGVSDYYSSMLSSAMSNSDFVQNLQASLQMDEYAADASTLTPSRSNASMITGASPVGPLCFDRGLSISGAALNIGAKVVGGIIKAVVNASVSLFKRAAEKVYQITTNPYDLKKLDGAGRNLTVDGWCYSSSNDASDYYFARHSLMPLNLIGLIDEESLSKVLQPAFAARAHRWNTIFGDFAFEMTGPGFKYVTGFEAWGYTFHSDGWDIPMNYQFYPRSLKGAFAAQLALGYDQLVTEVYSIPASGGEGQPSYVYVEESTGLRTINEALKRIKAAGDYAYYTPNDSEVEVAAGFRNSTWFASILAAIITAVRVSGSIDGRPVVVARVLEDLMLHHPARYRGVTNDAAAWASFNSPSLQTTISNVDLLGACAGYHGGQWIADFVPEEFLPKDYSTRFTDCRLRLSNLALPVLLSYIDDVYSASASLDAFYPYRVGDPVNPDPTYGIATDGDNYEAFNSFATGAIVLVAAVAIGSIFKFGVKKLSTRNALKKLRRQQIASQKNLNGVPLTRKERKALLGAQAKATMTNSMSGKTRSKSASSILANMSNYGAASEGGSILEILDGLVT